MKRKKLGASFVEVAGGFEAVITSTAIDRDGEVVIPQGMNSVEFEMNPVLFYNHDYNQPIGKATAPLRRMADKIVADFKLAEKPEGWSGAFFPEFVGALIGQGIVKGVSIGYVPEQGGMRRATPDDRKRFGDSVHTVYSKWKLLEVSVAPLQANPLALITAVRKGAIAEDDARRWLNYSPPPRVQIVVDLPAPVRASRKSAKPIDVASIAAEQIARARGKLWM